MPRYGDERGRDDDRREQPEREDSLMTSFAACGQSISDAFGLGPVRTFTHVADGMMARIWRLDTTSGSYAVKALRTVPGLDELHTRLHMSAQLADAARQAGIHSPSSIRAPSGDLLQRVGGGPGADAVYVTVATWIDGRPCDVARDAAAAARWLGETVATIELVPDPPHAPALDPWLAGWLTEAPTEAQWRSSLDQARQRERPWAGLLESRIPQLVSLGSIVSVPSDDHLTVMHTDLQPKNVLVTSTGFALLDWDDAALCSRDRILARTLVEWLTPGGIDPAAIVRFMRAYWSCGGTGAIHDLRDFGYVAAAFLNYVHETATSDLSDERGDSTRRVTEALTNPPNISILTRVIDIVGGLSRGSSAQSRGPG